MTQHTANWEDYWAGGGRADCAMAGAAQRDFLARHWLETFSRCQLDAPTIIDIASGDGAALRFAERGLRIAFDSAAPAVRAAARSLPGVFGVVADAGRLPFADQSVDLAVSQFGIEYAGEDAFAEAARVLKPDGALVALCHMRGGSIEAECAENSRLLTALAQSHLAACARAALRASYERHAKGRPPLHKESERALRAAFSAVGAALAAAPESAAKRAITHFVAELSIVSERRLAYAPTEALAWLASMSGTFAPYLGRMVSMQQAALDRDGLELVRAIFAARRFDRFDARAVEFIPGQGPSAWRIEARAGRH